jgi:hypothetical protein
VAIQVHGYFIRLINSLLCRLHQRRSENPRFLDVVFRKHNDPKILLNVNLLTSRSFWSRIHAPRSRELDLPADQRGEPSS